MDLTRFSDEPLYRQITGQIANWIATGRLAPVATVNPEQAMAFQAQGRRVRRQCT